jgi:hypothetical protein
MSMMGTDSPPTYNAATGLTDQHDLPSYDQEPTSSVLIPEKEKGETLEGASSATATTSEDDTSAAGPSSSSNGGGWLKRRIDKRAERRAKESEEQAAANKAMMDKVRVGVGIVVPIVRDSSEPQGNTQYELLLIYRPQWIIKGTIGRNSWMSG